MKEGCGLERWNCNASQDAEIFIVLIRITALNLKLSGLTIPNGIAWTQNNERMYHVDTGDQCVRSYFFDAAYRRDQI